MELNYPTTKKEYRKQLNLFEKEFNNDNFQNIFELLSSNFKKHLSENQMVSELEQLKKEYGPIVTLKFDKYVNWTFTRYLATCEKGKIWITISFNSFSEINGLSIKDIEPIKNKIVKNRTKLILPFLGQWRVAWGGDTEELNYHVVYRGQNYAFDFIRTNKQGNTFKNEGHKNEDYYAFNEKIISPCRGEVVQIVDGVEDNFPGHPEMLYIPGNTVVLKTELNEYLYFAHFKQFSINLKNGQLIDKGQMIGRCGNSGNSSEPHLHFHVQDHLKLTMGNGIKCYFQDIVVDGHSEQNYSPIKGETIENG